MLMKFEEFFKHIYIYISIVRKMGILSESVEGNLFSPVVMNFKHISIMQIRSWEGTRIFSFRKKLPTIEIMEIIN